MMAGPMLILAPGLVTKLVREYGVQSLWLFVLAVPAGMFSVFLFANRWHRVDGSTDLDLYEMRYNRPVARTLRWVRAVFFGGAANVVFLAVMMLEIVNLTQLTVALPRIPTIFALGGIALGIALLGDLKTIARVQAFLVGVGIVAFLVFAVTSLWLSGVGSVETFHATKETHDLLNAPPIFTTMEAALVLFLFPFAVCWWCGMPMGAEPGGGGGPNAQRLLAADGELSVLRGAFAQQALVLILTVWPLAVIALSSVVLFPSYVEIEEAFPVLSPGRSQPADAFPAMLIFLPGGQLGLVIAGLMAWAVAPMIGYLNWGASYLAHNLYHEHLRPGANDARLLFVGRVCMVVLVGLAVTVCLMSDSLVHPLRALLKVGMGIGPLLFLRWFWGRVNATSELITLFAAIATSFFMEFALPVLNQAGFVSYWPTWVSFSVCILVPNIVGAIALAVSTPEPEGTFENFCKQMHPCTNLVWRVMGAVLGSFVGIYLFWSVGAWVLHQYSQAIATTFGFVASAGLLAMMWHRLEEPHVVH